MQHLRTGAMVAVIGLLLCVIVWQFVVGTYTSLQTSFADEQTELFVTMANEAADALKSDPPQVNTAVGCLVSIQQYYPSGTKQTRGSRLDRIVERARSQAERQIIEMLRTITGKDLGSDPERWESELSGLKPNPDR